MRLVTLAFSAPYKCSYLLTYLLTYLCRLGRLSVWQRLSHDSGGVSSSHDRDESVDLRERLLRKRRRWWHGWWERQTERV